jgi:hypothetical protein
MRIAHGLTIDDADGGGVRVVARDWPWAGWLAVPALAAGLPLVGWAAVTGHGIEFGGGAVFCAFGAVCAVLAAAKRRDVVVLPGSARGREGAGPFARPVAFEWTGAARLEIRAFPVPEGAPDLADRGGDLVIVAPQGELRLVVRAGPGWRDELGGARARVVERIRSLG